MPSAIWTGAISFGLVQVPVRLVTATRNKDVSFNQLEAGTGARIRYRKVSDATGDEVPADRIEKGYEISKGRYVVVDAEEIEGLRPRGSHTIEIEEFVDLDDIDPLYFEQPYYLAPDAKGVKPYLLLAEAMTESNKVAIGRIVLRSKERLVAIRPIDGILCIETMRYHDEVVARDEIMPADATSVELSERERRMAHQLVESLAVDEFDPEKYHDQYREQLLDLIERKAAGEEIVAKPAAEAAPKVLDLVAALEASLAQAATAKERHPSAGAAKDPAAKPAAKGRAAAGSEDGAAGDAASDSDDGEAVPARTRKSRAKRSA